MAVNQEISGTRPPVSQAERPLLRLAGIGKSYRQGAQVRPVLQECSASVASGERVALIGRSGSGKSTLLNIISGIDQADAGQLWFDDTELGALDERARTLWRRHRVGFVFQFFNLVPTLTVLENLLLPLQLTGRLDATGRADAQTLLQRVGLGDRGTTFPDRLSGGEQQRVAIARALVHRPALLLADEPTGTLDETTGEAILDLLFELGAERGMTLLMVTHSRELAARADRVLQLRKGRLEPADGVRA